MYHTYDIYNIHVERFGLLEMKVKVANQRIQGPPLSLPVGPLTLHTSVNKRTLLSPSKFEK